MNLWATASVRQCTVYELIMQTLNKFAGLWKVKLTLLTRSLMMRCPATVTVSVAIKSSAASIEKHNTFDWRFVRRTHGTEAKIVWLDLKESLKRWVCVLTFPQMLCEFKSLLCFVLVTLVVCWPRKPSSYFLALVFFSFQVSVYRMCVWEP